MKLNKEEFLNSDIGVELQNCIEAWDSALGERRKAGAESAGDPGGGLGFRYWDDTCKWCEAQWEVYKMVFRQFFGMDYCFSRTDGYFGIVTEDEEDWLFKVERDI